MNINELTIGQVKELQKIFGSKGMSGLIEENPYQVGKPYFIRTVTHYYVGRLVAVYAQELVLEDAAWIADTGRFHVAMSTGVYDEVEPYPVGNVVIGRGAVIDATLAPVTLPMEAK